MHLILTIAVALVTPVLVKGDYECLCSYKVEMPVNSQVRIVTIFQWNHSTGYMSLVMRNPVFGVCDQVKLKSACSATEAS